MMGANIVGKASIMIYIRFAISNLDAEKIPYVAGNPNGKLIEADLCVIYTLSIDKKNSTHLSG